MRALNALLLLVACGAVVACGPSEVPAAPAPALAPAAKAGSASGPRIICSAEINILCPDGYENGCIGDRTTSHACVRKGLEARTSCMAQIVHSCPDGEINSCFATPPYGTKHICVKT